MADDDNPAQNDSTTDATSQAEDYSLADWEYEKLELEIAEQMLKEGVDNVGDMQAMDADTLAKAKAAFAAKPVPPGADLVTEEDEANAQLASEYAVGEKTLPIPTDQALLSKIIDYFLRKWAAFEIYNADVEEHALPSKTPPNVYTVRYPGGSRGKSDDDDEADGGETGWFIMESEESIKTGRVNLTDDLAGLAPYQEALRQMVAKANEKGWKNIGFLGFSPDMAWVAVQEHNIKHQDHMMDVVNYMPEDQPLDRYRGLLREVAERTLQAQSAGR